MRYLGCCIQHCDFAEPCSMFLCSTSTPSRRRPTRARSDTPLSPWMYLLKIFFFTASHRSQTQPAAKKCLPLLSIIRAGRPPASSSSTLVSCRVFCPWQLLGSPLQPAALEPSLGRSGRQPQLHDRRHGLNHHMSCHRAPAPVGALLGSCTPGFPPPGSTIQESRPRSTPCAQVGHKNNTDGAVQRI